MRIGTDSKHHVMRFLEKQFKRFAKKFWLPANTTACVCACARAAASIQITLPYNGICVFAAVCCSHFLSFSPLTCIFTPQSIGDSCIRGGVSPLAPVHLDNVLRAQQFHSDVKQNNWLRSVGWQGLIWMFFFFIENTINYVVRNNILQMLCPTTGAVSCTSIAHTVLYMSVFVWVV